VDHELPNAGFNDYGVLDRLTLLKTVT
jgi:hypothetical protein